MRAPRHRSLFALFAAYRRLFRVVEALYRRFTPAGLAALGALVVFAAVGIDTSQSMAFQLFALTLCGLAVSMLASLARPPALHVERLLPRFATVGQDFAYTLQLRNDSPAPLRGLRLRDGLEALEPEHWQVEQAVAQRLREPWTERLSGLRFYSRVLHRARGGRTQTIALPDLMPGETLKLRLSLLPLRRGTVEFTHVDLIRPDPLGLAQAVRRITLGSYTVALPQRHRVRRIDLAGSRRYQRGGVSLAATVGDSEEFIGLRAYRPGDALRSIHWRSFARTGRPLVKEFQDEFFVRYGLVLDTFAAPVDDDLFEAGVSVACSLAMAERRSDSLLDLLLVENRLYRFTVGRGVGSTDQLLHILAGVRRCASDGFATLASACAAQAPQLSGVYLVLLGWDEMRRQLVRSLLARKLDLRVALLCRDAGPDAAEIAELGGRLRCLKPSTLAADLSAL